MKSKPIGMIEIGAEVMTTEIERAELPAGTVLDWHRFLAALARFKAGSEGLQTGQLKALLANFRSKLEA